MVKRIGGARRKSRHKLKKDYKDKGKTPLRKHLQEFEEGQEVRLKADPSVQGGMYNLRFHGHVGTVVGEQGDCYKVEVEDDTTVKTFIVNPVHLEEVEE